MASATQRIASVRTCGTTAVEVWILVLGPRSIQLHSSRLSNACVTLVTIRPTVGGFGAPQRSDESSDEFVMRPARLNYASGNGSEYGSPANSSSNALCVDIAT